MDFVDVWMAKEWPSATALEYALDAVRTNGRERALVEWVDKNIDSNTADFMSIVVDKGWSDEEALAVIIAYGDDSGFSKQLGAYARRQARKNPPDPDHYGN